jgi:putative ABC transport system substrate-binding protein
MRGGYIRRRDFIRVLGGAAAWPLAARAQESRLPVIGFVSGRAPEDSATPGAAFRKGLAESGITDGQNATVEYHWLDGQYDQLPSLMAELLRRRVAVIATPGSGPASLAAKAATNTVPIVFGVAEDPVGRGLVASLARPGANATGINFFAAEVVTKLMALLHEIAPTAVRIAVLVNPTNTTNVESTLREARQAASALGLQVQVMEARTVGEIETAFGTVVREKADALFVGPDAFLGSRRVQLVVLAARHGVPMAAADSAFVEAGALMSYGTDVADMYRQVGAYAGRILKGAKPADLPVQQASKFEFVINLSTAKALGLDVPPALLLRADEVIE